MPPALPNYYTMLGLSRSASAEEIRHAYLKHAKKLHPDTNLAPGETELFLDVQQAYQVLSDPQRRAAYDATLPPEVEKTADSPVVLDTLLSRKQISSGGGSQLIYILMDFLQAQKTEESGTPPLNLCLALDNSTSMKGASLDVVKATTSQLLRRMRPQDIFSIVSFNDRAEVVVPASRQTNLHRAENRAQMLQAFGGTEILRGLEAALEEVRRYAGRGTVNHIVLLTDGRTYGDEQACYNLAQQAAQEGIGISGLGIGSGWNDTFLDKLATLTGGNSIYVSQPQDIERFLNEKFSHLSHTYAENIILRLQETPRARINYAFRLQPEVGPLAIGPVMRLGPILHDTPLTVILEINISGATPDEEIIELLLGKAEVISAILPAPIPDIPLKVQVSVNPESHTETPPATLVQALSKLTLYRIQERAQESVKKGEYVKATQQLQRLATHLLGQGEQALARTILLEVENIEKNQAFSDAGEKQIKYGTRALFLPTGGRK